MIGTPTRSCTLLLGFGSQARPGRQRKKGEDTFQCGPARRRADDHLSPWERPSKQVPPEGFAPSPSTFVALRPFFRSVARWKKHRQGAGIEDSLTHPKVSSGHAISCGRNLGSPKRDSLMLAEPVARGRYITSVIVTVIDSIRPVKTRREKSQTRDSVE